MRTTESVGMAGGSPRVAFASNVAMPMNMNMNAMMQQMGMGGALPANMQNMMASMSPQKSFGAGMKGAPQGWRSAPASPRSLSPLPGRSSARSSRGNSPSRGMSPARGNSPARLGTGQSEGGGARASGIKVVVRVRPLNDVEQTNGDGEVAEVLGPRGVRVVSSASSSSRADERKPVLSATGRAKQNDFEFHACLGPHVQQSDVFGVCGMSQLIDAAMRGYNVSLLAYGQTGSGKTYTMAGKEHIIASKGFDGGGPNGPGSTDGVIPRCIKHLFGAIEQRKAKRQQGEGTRLDISMVEVYNEQVYDLMDFSDKPLAVKWDSDAGFYVDKCKMIHVNEAEEALRALQHGMIHRRRGAHELNRESSRSHSVFTVHIATTAVDETTGRPVTRRSKLLFVDLAGSERLKMTKTQGTGLKETGSINKSLFTLGKVISVLGDGSKGQIHVPYRDSLLTKLLMDSIGGSALTLLIACVSPAGSHVDQTLSTLTYAQKAKNIRNKPVIQVDHADAEVLALQRELALLREENTYLRRHVTHAGNNGGGSVAGDVTPGAQPSRSGSFAGNAMPPSNQGSRPDTANTDLTQNEEVALLRSLSHSASKAGGAGAEQSEQRAKAMAEEAGRAVGRLKAKTDADLNRLGPQELVYELRRATELISKLSDEFDEWSSERSRLRASRQLLALDHKSLAQENEQLRHKVALLESLFRSKGGGALPHDLHGGALSPSTPYGALGGGGGLRLDVSQSEGRLDSMPRDSASWAPSPVAAHPEHMAPPSMSRLGQPQMPVDGAASDARSNPEVIRGILRNESEGAKSISESERGGGKYLDRVRRQMETTASEPGSDRGEMTANGMGPAEIRARERKGSGGGRDPLYMGADEDPLALVGNGAMAAHRPPSRVKEDPKAVGNISVSQKGMGLLLDN